MKQIFILCFAVIAMVGIAQNKPMTASQITTAKEQINQTASAIKTMRCQFSQRKAIALLSQDIVSQGVMEYAASDRLRWEYKKPYSYIFLMNGNRVLLKNDKSSSTFDTNSNRLFKEISSIMISSVNGQGLNDDRNFSAEFFTNPIGTLVYLTPKSKEMRQFIAQIKLQFDSKSIVKSIELVEKSGDNTIITLDTRELNIKLEDEIFSIN